MIKVKPKRKRKESERWLSNGHEVFRCDPALNTKCKKTACKYNMSIPPKSRVCELTLNPDCRLRHGRKAKKFKLKQTFDVI